MSSRADSNAPNVDPAHHAPRRYSGWSRLIARNGRLLLAFAILGAMLVGTAGDLVMIFVGVPFSSVAQTSTGVSHPP